MLANLDRAREALQAIPPNLPRDEWVRAGMAAQAAGLGFDDFNEWSAGAGNYDERAARDTWRSLKPGKGIGEATLYRMAAEYGCGKRRQRPSKAPARPTEPVRPPRRSMGAAEVWARCKLATATHGYIVAKDGRPEGLRVVPDADRLRIAGESVAGWLVVPVLPLDGGDPVSLQFIPPPGEGKKLNLPGASMAGVFTVGEPAQGGAVYLCEGIGQAWACWKATGAASVVCFGWGRVRAVAAEMRQRDASARLVLVPDAGKEDDAEAIALEVGAEVVTMPGGSAPNYDANDYAAENGHDALSVLLAGARGQPALALPFAVVPFADLASTEPAPPTFVWEGLIPAGHVTLLSAHGGIGKSTVALMLAVAVAAGLTLFDIPTRRGTVAFYSGEDGREMLRHRLKLVCKCLGVGIEALDGRLHILDATEDPVLFYESSARGHREGQTSPTFDKLREFVVAKRVSLLVVDNASDAFDASEIDRAMVRGFMRSLAGIAREIDAGLLLLAHVDKGTSRGDRGPNSEGYSGSTAWNNSARSRMFMSRDKDGYLLLEHQKNNLGRLHETLRLTWPDGGIPQSDKPMQPVMQRAADDGHEKAMLRLIAEFTARGEAVSPSTNSRTHAAKLLNKEPSYPKLKDGDVFDVLRRAERAGHLQRIGFKGADRKPREKWQVTASGAAFAGIAAASAASAATSDVIAPAAPAASAAASAASALPGGVGEKARTEVAAVSGSVPRPMTFVVPPGLLDAQQPSAALSL